VHVEVKGKFKKDPEKLYLGPAILNASIVGVPQAVCPFFIAEDC